MKQPKQPTLEDKLDLLLDEFEKWSPLRRKLVAACAHAERLVDPQLRPVIDPEQFYRYAEVERLTGFKYAPVNKAANAKQLKRTSYKTTFKGEWLLEWLHRDNAEVE